MATKIAHPETISTKLVNRWEQVCAKINALAQEIPAGQFDYRPVDDTRTVAEVLRHIAFWNIYVADSARGKTADDSANELPAARFSTKAQIIAALNNSAADVSNALSQGSQELSPQTAEMLVTFIEHNCEHYGQLVVYARLNGIIPPASRG